MKLFKAGVPSRALAEGSGTGDAYIDAKTVWFERYGSHIQSAYNWRLVAILEAIGIIVAILALGYVGAQSKFVPYVVAVDKIGLPVGVKVADHAEPVDQRVVRAEIAGWLSNARSVVTDRIVEKQDIDQVYALIGDGSAARGYLDNWYTNGHSPFDLARNETTTINVDSLLPISPTTWQVQWTETQRDLHGQTIGTQEWVGNVGIMIHQPTDEATLLKNPLGVYITTLDWTKKL